MRNLTMLLAHLYNVKLIGRYNSILALQFCYAVRSCKSLVRLPIRSCHYSVHLLTLTWCTASLYSVNVHLAVILLCYVLRLLVCVPLHCAPCSDVVYSFLEWRCRGFKELDVATIVDLLHCKPA